jgi:3-mercaptopyruvate sulfurtransferase SseA
MMRIVWVAAVLAAAAFASYGQEYKKFKDDTEVPRITLEDAKKAFDNNSALFVDARSLDVYKQEHITGAIDVPFGAPESQVDSIPKGKTIIVYCT